MESVERVSQTQKSVTLQITDTIPSSSDPISILLPDTLIHTFPQNALYFVLMNGGLFILVLMNLCNLWTGVCLSMSQLTEWLEGIHPGQVPVYCRMHTHNNLEPAIDRNMHVFVGENWSTMQALGEHALKSLGFETRIFFFWGESAKSSILQLNLNMVWQKPWKPLLSDW